MADFESDPSQYSSSVTLQVDEETETLGSLQPRLINDQERRVLLKQALSCRVAADVVTLAHGTCKNGHPASLLALRFQFSYPPQSANRLTSAHISISFQAGSGDDETSFPWVHRFAPRSIRADATTATVTNSSALGATASLLAGQSVSPVGLAINAERASEISFDQTFGCHVTGEPWTSDEAYDQGSEVDNSVTWHLHEHKLHKRGISRELRVVLVVGRSQKLVMAKVKAKVKTGWGLSLFGSLFSQGRPLIIGEGTEFGTSPGVDSFDDLSEEQLGDFVGVEAPLT